MIGRFGIPTPHAFCVGEMVFSYIVYAFGLTTHSNPAQFTDPTF